MKKLCLALLLVFIAAATAMAHELSLIAVVSLDHNQLQVRALDPYGAALEGATVTATPLTPGGKDGRPVALAEGPAGTYREELPLTGEQEVRVDVVIAGDLFRVLLKTRTGESLAEQQLPMMAIDEEPHFSWGPYLYGAAVIILLTATGVALLRRRQAAEEEDE